MNSLILAGMMSQGGGSPKVYATFDPTRTSGNITLSGDNLTATKGVTGWTVSFFNTDKLSGLWAIEISQNNLGSGARYSLIGMQNTLNTSGIMGTTSGVSMAYASLGYNIVDGAFTNPPFQVTPAANYKELVVFDYDNKRVLAKRSGVLGAGNPTPGSGPFYAGVAMYMNTLTSCTIMTGQVAFTAENETMMSDYETANSVTINRGFWG